MPDPLGWTPPDTPLWQACRLLPTDYEPYGERSRWDGSDCSCGCRHFVHVHEATGDWGVCINPQSPRRGLLTWEHQGCEAFEDEDDA